MAAGFDRLVQERRRRLAAEQERNHAEARLMALRAEVAAARAMASAGEAFARVPARLGAARPRDPQVEGLIRTGLDLISDGFAIYGPGGALLFANRAYRRVLEGLDEAGQLVDYRQICAQLISSGQVQFDAPENPPGETPQAWLERVLARWNEDPVPDCVIRFRSGRAARMMEFREGDLVVSLVRDITAALHRQADLDLALRHAEGASRAKSAFLANMSHEIRTPMNGIVGMAQILAAGDLSPEQRQGLATIRASGEALLGVIGDVLDYSRLEAEALSLAPQPFDLERGILELLVLQEAEAQRRGIALTLDYALGTPTRFLADPARMRQVLGNLIGNAVKFTELGEVRVEVTMAADGVEIAIRDTGIGISPDDQARIFQGFEQVDDDANRRFDGAGLGLAITHRLVSLMAGRIRVESRLGEGALFVVELPLEALEAPEADAPGERTPPPRSSVLLVIEEGVERSLLQRQLEALGAEVVLARDAGEGLRQIEARAGGFDLVIAEAGFTAGGRFASLKGSLSGMAGTVLVGFGEEAAAGQPVLSRTAGRAELWGLLMRPGARLADDEKATAGNGACREPVAPRRPRVLVAEDNATNRLVFSSMVSELEIELAFAEDGQIAVEKFAELGPELVFMDISMPRMDGREATQRIRALPGGAGVPILALTAHANGGGFEDFAGAGMDGLLPKPFRKAELLAIIAQYLPVAVEPGAPVASG